MTPFQPETSVKSSSVVDRRAQVEMVARGFGLDNGLQETEATEIVG